MQNINKLLLKRVSTLLEKCPNLECQVKTFLQELVML